MAIIRVFLLASNKNSRFHAMLNNEEVCEKSIYDSLTPSKTYTHHLWKIDKIDQFSFSIYLIMLLISWIFTFLNGDFISPLAYWDGPNYVYVAKTLYNIPENNPWKREFNYPAYYFACHLPGFPIIIKLFAFLTFNCYWLGDIIAIIFCSFLSLYVFRRLLIVYDCVNDPKWTCLIFLCIPLRNCLYRLVGASEPLFISLCYLALIFYKIDKKLFMLLSLIGACFTRIEGLAIVGTIGLCYLLRLDFIGAIITSLSFSVHIFLLYLHQIKFGTYKAYFIFNQGLIKFKPFYALIENSKNFQSIQYLFPILHLHVLMIFGCLVLFATSIPLAIFSTVYLIYNSMLFHIDVYRYALPGYILCILVGFDAIWSHPTFKKYFYIPLFFYLLSSIGYFIGQICTNRSSAEFLYDVMNPSRP
ncbi:hypothetical protein TRFO_07016 [Tritrichomonas foetus]|uniref:GPI mannosyltransferase 2 n=1 Tax=Tritrichomonas foetus TaxID=1144522 RepID=A0A1J4JYJ7_9EUKA|nr:hypothetical protein TRFO_07016 [Tritrichomonas foetus]|eukprot:OHT02604.1 hypothetical protein TRFO_07016 [Tritrichomonas foetus]